MPGRTELRGLDRYLLRGERLVVVIRRHRVVLLKPAVLAVLGFFLALWVDLHATSDGARAVERMAWAVALAALLWFGWHWMEWRHERFVVTDKRILLFRGFITRKVPMMPLTKVTDMTYERSILGRVLGYGTFVLESAGQDQAISQIDHVPDPDATYRGIVAEIFGVGDEEGTHDGEDWADEEPEEALRRPRLLAAGRRGPGASVYRSADRDRRPVADTGELPPYDPDWRP